MVRAAGEGYRFFVVLLDDNPSGGAPTFAGAVLDRLGSGTVLVLSSSQEGMESTEFTQAATRCRTRSAATRRAAVMPGTSTPWLPCSPVQRHLPAADGSKTGLFLMLGFIGLLVLLVWWAIRRQRRTTAQSEERMIAEARKEIKSQLDAMANTILDISDRVSATDTKQDNQYLEQAGATYGTAMEEYEQALDIRGLEAMSDRLDEARWQLDAATALAYGREVPPKPEKEVRHQCFFDPNHPEATEIADLATSAGTKKVRVCKDDAEKLRRGQQPKARMIRVAGPQRAGAHGPPLARRRWHGLAQRVLGGAGRHGAEAVLRLEPHPAQQRWRTVRVRRRHVRLGRPAHHHLPDIVLPILLGCQAHQGGTQSPSSPLDRPSCPREPVSSWASGPRL